MTRELRVGDIIEVHQVELTGVIAKDVWKAAQIIEVRSHRLGVRFVREPTKLLYVAVSEHGRQWR